MNAYDEFLASERPEDDEQQRELRLTIGSEPSPPNAYDALLANDRKQKTAQLGQVVKDGQQTTPDKRAEALTLGRAFGVPPEIVERNLETYRSMLAQKSSVYDEMLSSSPKLSNWMLADPTRAGAILDDTKRLADQERIITGMGAVMRGIDNIQGMVGRAAQWWGTATGNERIQAYGRRVAERNEAESAAAGHRTSLGEIKDFASMGQWLKETAGEQLPIWGTMLAGATAGAAVGAPLGGVGAIPGATIGGILGAFVPSFVLGIGTAEGAVRKIDPERDAPVSVFIGGSAIAAFDTALPGMLGSRLVRTFGAEVAEEVVKKALLAPVKPQFLVGTLKEGFHGFLTEGITEAIQGGIEQVTGAAATGTSVDTEQLWRQMLEEGVAGAVMGGAMSASTRAASQKALDAKYAAALTQKDFYTALGNNAKESPVAQRLPELYQDALAAMLKDGPVETVFVDPDVWTDYWTKQNISAEVMAAELTGKLDALQQARETRTDLAIPTAAYAAKLAGTDHNAFFADELRLREDLPNARETAEEQAAVDEVAATMADAVTKAAKDQAEGKPVETSPLREAIQAQLMKDPGFHNMIARNKADAVQVSGVYAAAVEGMLTNLGRKVGQDPIDLVAEYGLSIGDQGAVAAMEAVKTAQAAAQQARQQTIDPASVSQEPGEAGPATTAPGEELHQSALPPLAVAPATVDEVGRLTISTRVPSAVKAPEAENDVPLRTDLAAAKQSPSWIKAALTAVRKFGQVKADTARKTDAAVSKAFVDQMVSNLIWLHDLYPKHLRDRAKLWYVGAHRIGLELADKYEIAFEQAAAVLASMSPQKDWYQNVSLAERAIETYQLLERTNPTFDAGLWDHFEARFRATVENEAKTRGGDAYRKGKLADLAHMKKAMFGRKWSDLSLPMQGRMLRAHSEVHQSPSYHVILPEGERGALARTKDGKPARVGWNDNGVVVKVILALRDGSVESINELLGKEHKVRSFFNNISNPWDPNSVTIDTHAIAAARLEPLGGNDASVKATMSGSGDALAGLSGANAFYGEAYFKAAEQLGILPRELQSITWEAVRGLFSPEQKRSDLPDQVRKLWTSVRTGRITQEAFRDQLLTLAEGIAEPAWAHTAARVALDEGRLRQGDVLLGRQGPGVPAAGSRDLGDPGRPARRLTDLAPGRVLPVATITAGAVDQRLEHTDRRAAVTRTIGRFRDAKTRIYEGKSDRTDPKVRRLGNTFTPNGRFAQELAAAGYPTPHFQELPADDGASFRQAALAAQAVGFDPSLQVLPVKGYRSMRLFMSADGQAGFAINADGAIVSLFTHGGRALPATLALAVQEGGTKLTTYDTVLADLYALSGFRVVSRAAWDGFEHEAFADFNGGKPDVLAMEFDPVALKTGPITLYQDPLPTPTTDQWAYSRLQRAIELAKPEKATGRDWKAIIKGSKQGVNVEEFLLTSVDDLEDGKVYTKGAVLDYLRTHQVQVAWETLGATAPSEGQIQERLEQMIETHLTTVTDRALEERQLDWWSVVPYREPGAEFYQLFEHNWKTFDVKETPFDDRKFATFNEAQPVAAAINQPRLEAAQRAYREQRAASMNLEQFRRAAEQQLLDEMADQPESVKYQAWQLDNGDTAELGSYREVFLTAPNGSGAFGFSSLTKAESERLQELQKITGDTTLGNIRITMARARNAGLDDSKMTRSTIVGRIKDLTIALGGAARRGELDSSRALLWKEDLDLWQKVLEGGDYNWTDKTWVDGHDPYDHIQNPIVRLRYNVRSTVEAVVPAFVVVPPTDPVDLTATNPNARWRLAPTATPDKPTARMFATREDAEAWIATNTQRRRSGSRVLFLEEAQPPSKDNQAKMPELLTSNWRELAFKWALRQAAEMGLDGVAWTTGEQQAQRYGLEKVVKSIEWTDRDRMVNANRRLVRDLTLLNPSGGQNSLFVDQATGIVLYSSFTGRDLRGEALANVIGDELAARILAEPKGTLEGQDLRFGGEGLRTLYDQDFKNVVNKLPSVKKAGVRVGRTEVAREGNLSSEQWFVPMTPELKTSVLAGQALFQGDDEHRGAFQPSTGNIKFFETADLSTFLHEAAHLYLHIAGDLVEKVRRGDPASWSAGQRTLVEDFDKILRYLGVATHAEIGREQHEVFARSFEAYLMLGNAPTAELVAPFARFRSWLSNLYRSMIALRVKLTPEVIEVFDRIVAGDDAIEAARQAGKMQPSFATAEQAGMTELEFQGYQRQAETAHQQQKAAMTKRLMAEIAEKRSAWWAEKRVEVEAQVSSDLRNQPARKALLFLQRGELPDGSAVPVPIKLSKDSIVEKLGKDRLATLPKPYVYSVEGGLDVDDAAGMFGFSSGDEMIKALAATTDKLEAAIQKETNARMEQEFGAMRLDQTELRAAAEAEVATNGYEELLTAELRAIARLERAARPVVTAARKQESQEEASARRSMRRTLNATIMPVAVLDAIATQRLEGLTPSEMRPERFWQAAQKAARESGEALEAGRYEDAVRFKKAQRLAVAMHKASQAAIDEVEQLRKYAKRLGMKQSQARLGHAGESYQAQVNDLLNRFEFQRVSGKALERREKLVEWVAKRKAEGRQVDHVPAAVLDAARQTNYQQVPMVLLRDLRDTLKTIEHLARTKNTLLASKDQREFDAIRDEAVTSIKAHNPNARPPVLEYRKREERKHTIEDFFASHSRIATLAAKLDGYVDGGPIWSLIVRPLNEAQDDEVTRRQEAGTRLNEIIKKHYPGRDLASWNKKIHIDALGRSMTKEATIAVALNWGNDGNRERILNDPDVRTRMAPHQVAAVLDTLERKDFEFVQDVFDFVNSFWPEISDKQFRVTGIRPEKVEATPIVTKFGIYAGGYYPLVWEQRRERGGRNTSIIEEAKQQLSGAYMHAQTKRGHLQARQENVQRSVKLEVGGVIAGHLDRVIHDLTHHEVLLDVSKAMRDRTLRSAMFDVIGDVGIEQFESAIMDIAVGKRPSENFLDRAASFAKTGAQIAGLGLNLWTAAQQPLGLFNGAQRVGAKWVWRGASRWLRDATTAQNTLEWIREVSPFMASRAITNSQDLNDLRNRLSEPGGWFDAMVRDVTGNKHTQQSITDGFLWHIGLMQRVADVPTWLGQFEKSMASGKSEKDAIAEADQAVRDSQGGGQLVDLAKIQRGRPVARLFMVFYSYGNTVFNATARSVGEFKQSTSPARSIKLLGDLSLLYFMPALLTTLLARLLKGSGDDDDDLFDISKDVLAEMGGGAINTMVGVRELGGLLRSSNRGYEGPAGTRLMKEIYRAFDQVSQGEVDEGLWKSLNATGGVLFHYPSAQLERTVGGFIELAEGHSSNPLVLLFGPEQKQK